ncbi:MAG: hypothetical protein J6O49_14565 [Bacteroidaceae bacterium]|nr:hypothetical protein [Bacteroidaceae bacterium]
MAVYLREFTNHAAYEAAESSLIKPNVSLCAQENEVHYNPSSPSQEYVDLGLPSGTKWAKCNVGATSETEYGNYYQYGKGADQYAATSGQSVYSGTENPLALSADTAVQVLGGSWHMPTKAQFEELTANTTYEWTTINGVNGRKFTAQNGNYVFFPAAGFWGDGIHKGVGGGGNYWSSTPIDSTNAYSLAFDDENMYVDGGDNSGGCSVRGVVDE